LERQVSTAAKRLAVSSTEPRPTSRSMVSRIICRGKPGEEAGHQWVVGKELVEPGDDGEIGSRVERGQSCPIEGVRLPEGYGGRQSELCDAAGPSIR
jgi:hypothetical protein